MIQKKLVQLVQLVKFVSYLLTTPNVGKMVMGIRGSQ